MITNYGCSTSHWDRGMPLHFYNPAYGNAMKGGSILAPASAD